MIPPDATPQSDREHRAVVSQDPDPRAPLTQTWDALASVIDPELGLDIVTLGLVYEVEVDGAGLATITHTLTTPGCPMERVISSGIREAISVVPGITGVEIKLVWEPAWHTGMIQPGAL